MLRDLLTAEGFQTGRRHVATLMKTLGFETPDEVFARLVDKTVIAVTSRNVEGVRYGT